MDTIFTLIQNIAIQGGLALLICIILLIASALLVIYVDSVTNCLRYLLRTTPPDEDPTLQYQVIHDPLQGMNLTNSPAISLTGLVYLGFLLLDLIPIVNTFLLIHSVVPFFKTLKKIRNNPYLTLHYYKDAKNYLAKNPEVKSKLYHSFILQLILKYRFKVRSRLIFS
jgi:hypothetical protein